MNQQGKRKGDCSVIGKIGTFTIIETKNHDGSSLEEKIRIFVKRKGILAEDEELIAYSELFDWKRGGSETYIAAGKVRYEKEGEISTRLFMAKAIVTSLCPELSLQLMIKRREVVESADIPVPRLYSHGEGVIYEEFINDDFKKIFGELEREQRRGLIQQLGEIAAKLDLLKFHPLDFTRDLRVKDNVIYYVDFGFDLGDPYVSTSQKARETITKFLRDEKEKEKALREYNHIFRTS